MAVHQGGGFTIGRREGWKGKVELEINITYSAISSRRIKGTVSVLPWLQCSHLCVCICVVDEQTAIGSSGAEGLTPRGHSWRQALTLFLLFGEHLSSGHVPKERIPRRIWSKTKHQQQQQHWYYKYETIWHMVTKKIRTTIIRTRYFPFCSQVASKMCSFEALVVWLPRNRTDVTGRVPQVLELSLYTSGHVALGFMIYSRQ